MGNHKGKKRGFFKRVFALIGVFLLLSLVICTLVFAVTGSPNFFGMLLITMMAPILLWIYMFLYRVLHGKSAREMAEEEMEHRKKRREERE